MTVSVGIPFIVFPDVDGDPLQNGYIYIGEAGLNPESNPVNTYWDSALTIPAAQPIRTSGGYPSRDGSPGRIYVAENDYSILTRNKNQSLVWSSLNSTDRISINQITGLEGIILSVATIEELRNTEPQANGQQIELLGSDNDGSIYYYDETRTDADNGGSVIVTSGGARWIRKILAFYNTTDYATLGSNVAGPISLVHSPGTVGNASTGITVDAFSYYIVKVDITTTDEGRIQILFDGTDALYGDQPNGLLFSDAPILNDASENNRFVTDNEYYFMLGTSTVGFTTLSVVTDTSWGGTIASIEIFEVDPKEFGLAITASDGIGRDNPMGVKGGAYNRGDIALGDKFTLGAFQFDGLSPTPAFNVAIGTRALGALFKGDQNTAVGSLALQSNEGSNNVGVGYSALKLNTKGQENTAVGYKCLTECTTGFRNTAFGFWAGEGIKTGTNNVDIGWRPIVAAGDKSGMTAVGSRAGTGLLDGDSNVFVGAGAGELLTNPTTLQFTAATAVGVNTQPWGDFCVTIGSGAMVGIENAGVVTFAPDAIAIGSNAKSENQRGIAIGRAAAVTTNAGIAIGDLTESNTDASIAIGNGVAVNGSRGIAIGDSASAAGSQSTVVGALSTPAGASNVAVGFRAGNNFNGSANTFLGHTAGLQAVETYSNCTLLGSLTAVTGSNQVQLGDSATTTYAYGAVQDRSDARDKLDISELTDAHIAFFMDVEWKQFRMNHRERYIDIDPDTGEQIEVENDGSRAGSRFHVGAIAQQVEAAMKKHGIDFAGLQHHSINGGQDVYTIGYQEFVGIQGEIIQRQQKTLQEILTRLDQAGI